MMTNWQPTFEDHQTDAAEGLNLPQWLLVCGSLLLALALGWFLPSILLLPKSAMALGCLAICGALGGVMWLALRLPILSTLRFALIASFWFRLEINLFPIFKNHAEPPGLNISLMLIVCTLLTAHWLYEQWQAGERQPVMSRACAVTLAAIWGWCALTVTYGAEDWLGFYAFWSASASILLCRAVTIQFSNVQALRQVTLWLAVLIAFNAFFGIGQAFIPALANFSLGNVAAEDTIAVGGEEVSRVRALFGISNAFAWTLVLFLPIVIAPLLLRVKFAQRWQQLLSLVATGAAVVVLILTYSRGSWIAFSLSLPLMAVAALAILQGAERRQALLRFAGVGVIVAVLALPFAPAILSRLTGDDRGSTESRVQMIQVAQAIIADNPVLGVGLSSYEAVMRNYDETADLITEHFDWPVHNVYLQVAAEAGLPGLALFLVLAGLAVRSGWRVLCEAQAARELRAQALGLLTGMFSYLVTALKEGSSYQSGQMRLFFLLCGLLFATEIACRRSLREREVEYVGIWEQSY